MPRAPASPAKPLEWSPPALRAYLETLAFIASQDPVTAQNVINRVERVLTDIAAFPAIGTPGSRRGERRFPIPNTGHVINYRILKRTIRIQGWYRARRRS